MVIVKSEASKSVKQTMNERLCMCVCVCVKELHCDCLGGVN